MEEKMRFMRYEHKFRINRFQRDALLLAMKDHLKMDAYGHVTVRNVYYDTETWRLIRRSIEKPLYKEKLRVRSYEQATDSSPVYVELKKKFERVVYKRRIVLPCQSAVEGLRPGNSLPYLEKYQQICGEIEVFKRFWGKTLAPAIFISYDREAYKPIDGSDFRVTIDENLLWRMEDIDLRSPVGGRYIIPSDALIMEVKTCGGIPLWMVRFLSENKIYKTSFSKVGTAYKMYFLKTNCMEE